MVQATSSDLLHRIEHLERKNFTLRLVGLVVALLLGGLLLTGISPTSPPDVIEAKTIHIKDSSGKTRISIMAEPPSEIGPTIELYDTAGRVRLQMFTSAHLGASILMDDPEGYSLLSLGTIGRESYIYLNTSEVIESGAPSITIGLLSSGEYHGLTVASPNRKNFARLYADNDGPSLVLEDSNQFRAVLGRVGTIIDKTGETQQTSAASLTLFGKDGKVIRQIP